MASEGVPQPQGFEIQGADGPIKVPAGKYYFNTRARCERMMKNHLSRGAHQVHNCLELATMNWRREVAMVKEKTGERPLTVTDISGETGIDKADVRRFLDELEDNGLAERRAKDGGALRKGAVLIYSWAQPQEPKKEKLGVRAPSIPEWIPDSWQALRAYANRCRYKIPDNLDEGARTLFLAEAEEAARDLERAQERVARVLDSVCAQPRPNKVDRTTDIRRQTSSSPPSSNGQVHVVVEEDKEPQIIEVPEEPRAIEVLPAVVPPAPEPVPTFEAFQSLYPGEVDPPSKPAFAKLKPAEKIACVRSLPAYQACGRWQNQQFIPRASRFIREEFWKFEPPPDRAPEDPKMASRKANMAETLAWARLWGKKT